MATHLNTHAALAIDQNPHRSIVPVQLPRVSIQFCTQCKWMLRAAYFAQELLSTFSTSLGEVSLIPSTGGVFIIDITHTARILDAAPVVTHDGQASTQTIRLWDRKAEGGFPETKTLKARVRDIIDPTRDLGHVDKKKTTKPVSNKLDEYGQNAQIGGMEEDGVRRVGDWRGGIGNGNGNDRGEECRDC